MKPKYPIWNFYSAQHDEKNTSVRCLDCNAEVSAKVLNLDEYPWQGRNSLFFFFFFFLPFLLNMNTKTWPNISAHHKNTTA